MQKCKLYDWDLSMMIPVKGRQFVKRAINVQLLKEASDAPKKKKKKSIKFL